MEERMQTELEEVLCISAVEYAKEAGKLILNHTESMGQIEQKKNSYDLVTEVDRKSEDFLKSKIMQRYPDHWILSEEETGQKNAYDALKSKFGEYGWIIDPIDGTTNFIHGIPHFSVSIGIVKNGQPVIGVVYNPVTGELFTARKSFGAFLNGQSIHVGKETKLIDSVLATGFQANDWKPDSRAVRQINQLAGKGRNVRIIGSASLDLCWTAAGRLTGFWHEGLNPWDAAAGVLILSEAGGFVTDKYGQPYQLHLDSLVASNAKIHEELIEVIQG
ncbi:inositol monophosphatase family protein [Cytobacillus sp. FSL R5-0596]|nr:inositol monophosphatase [Cytobacillus firmus]